MWFGCNRRTVINFLKLIRTDDQFIKLTGCEHRGFSNLKLLYLNMGYLSGIMMQAIPYDYRKSIVSSNIPDIIV